MASTTCSMAVSYMQSTKRFYRPASATQPGLISAAHHQHTRKSLPATISHKTNWSTPDGSGARTFITRNALAGQSQSDNIPTYMAGRRNIIMPVDNSDDSDFAVNWALKHLYKTGDCLHMLYCIPQYQNKMTFNDGEELAHVERQKATKEALRKRFENKFVQFNVPSEDLIYDILEEEHISAGLFGVEDIDLEDDKQAYEAIETRNMIGDVIIKKAQEFDSSAVVMSSHSKGPIAEFFLGSVTSYCSQHCSKPVVVLHNVPHPDSNDPKAAKGSGRAVAVAVDDSPLSEKSLQWTIDNVYRNGDVLHVMHVVPPVGKDVAVADGFGDGSAELNDGVSEKYRNLMEAAQIQYEIDLVQEHFIDSIKADSVRLGSALIGKAEDLDASVLVMASHGKGNVDQFILGSVTNFVTHNANDIPVIVLHP